MNRRTVLLLAAALVAALGTALVFLYVKGADNRAEERFETVEVLRAVTTIEQGESIDDAATNGKLALEAVAKNDVLPNSQTSTEALSGQVAVTTIYPGEQIISDKFGPAAEALAAKSDLDVPKNDIAISVNLTDPGRVAGFINPGSEVTVFFTGTPGSGIGFSRMLLPQVTVLGVGSTTTTTKTTTTAEGEQTTSEIPQTLLTLAVSKEEAEKVHFAVANGEVVLGLRTPDSSIKPGPGATFDNVFK
ncbi:Flp pilus assembly protein CpaB [Nocardioides sp.]|uniref:Flp pilus assembly protein CpaB n=1 Tax=Nocardioides sp. TaxID=35761 RepID=UPI002D7EF150|nr:Flp pilus assembly protein CpaB [Nocardioides sp.]HET8960279.1 Flp pilus assembly protein CpaB [Nocardioides sp.]